MDISPFLSILYTIGPMDFFAIIIAFAVIERLINYFNPNSE